MNITSTIAEFAAGLRFERIPQPALETTRTAVLDCLGVALAGSGEQDAKICAEIARQQDAKGESSVFGQCFMSSAIDAAFANGTAAHAMDFDHSFTLTGQPTAPIIPAVFALGEALGSNGRQIVEAYVAGFETTAKLVFSLRDATQESWHAPSNLGIFGAGVACAKLLGLDAPRMQMVLGIAASMAGGVVANFGTMTKPLHVGLAARNGVMAARLAQSGFTANPQAIEAGNGFYDGFYHGSPIDTRPIEELGNSYALETDGIRIKPYPCGGLTHPTIDATLELCATHGIDAEAVASVDAAVTKNTYSRIAFRVPQNGIQGRFCMPYLLARAIIDGKIGVDVFTDKAVRDEKVLRLAERVEMRFDPDLKANSPGGRPCRVTVGLKNGAVYSCDKEHAKGSPEAPLTEEERTAKFSECARRVLNPQDAGRAREWIAGLETLSDVRPLCQLLAG